MPRKWTHHADAGILGPQRFGIFGQHQEFARLQKRPAGEPETDPVGHRPSGHIDVGVAPVQEFDPSAGLGAFRRPVEDFVEDDVVMKPDGIGPPRTGRDRKPPRSRAIRKPGLRSRTDDQCIDHCIASGGREHQMIVAFRAEAQHRSRHGEQPVGW